MKEVKSLFLVFIAILIISMAGIFAYDASGAGHNVNEVDFSAGVDGDIVFNNNVGIGTTPSTPFALRGNGGTSDVGITQNQVGGVSTMELTTADAISNQATRLLIRGGNDESDIEFYRGSRGSETNTLFIEGRNGNVGIGTTNPQASLSVGGNGYSNAGVYASGRSYGVYAQGESFGLYAEGTGYAISAQGGSFGVSGSGTLFDFYAYGPGTNYGASSSMRWKENIVEIDNALDKVLALEGVYFDWNGVNNQTGHDMGMIAEDVGEIVPEVVQYEDRTNISNYYVEDGERKLYANGMDYGALTPMLVEAIKDQQKIIKDQQTQINELKTRVDALEN